MADASELLPCPFCGGRGSLKYTNIGRTDGLVQCAGCGARSRDESLGLPQDWSNVRNVWNSRTKVSKEGG